MGGARNFAGEVGNFDGEGWKGGIIFGEIGLVISKSGICKLFDKVWTFEEGFIVTWGFDDCFCSFEVDIFNCFVRDALILDVLFELQGVSLVLCFDSMISHLWLRKVQLWPLYSEKIRVFETVVLKIEI